MRFLALQDVYSIFYPIFYSRGRGNAVSQKAFVYSPTQGRVQTEGGSDPINLSVNTARSGPPGRSLFPSVCAAKTEASRS